MKIKISVILLLWTITLCGQVTVEKDIRISVLEKGKDFHPVFSPDGNKLLVTSANYTGLDLYDIETKTVKHITNDAGAGYNALFSEDGESVYFKQTLLKDRKQFKVLKMYDVTEQDIQSLSQPLRTSEEQNAQLRSTTGDDKIFVCTEKLKLVVYRNGRRTEMEPVGNVPGYLWTSLSPDGKMILFTAATKGTFICDLSGKIVASLGQLNAPAWYNDQYVVGMEDKDNGEVVTSSKIVMASLDGKIRQTLTSEDKVAMFPATSSKTKRIAYCTENGGIYIMKISINQ